MSFDKKIQERPNQMSSNPTWEVIGVITAFVGSANNAPELLNTILNFYSKSEEIPWFFKIVAILSYLLILIFAAGVIFWLRSRTKNNLSLEDKAVRAIRRRIFINYVLRFPISLIADLICRHYRVVNYEVMNRKKLRWPVRSDFFSQIVRFRTTGKTIEYQFSKNYKDIEIKETLPDSDTFGLSSVTDWKKASQKYLVFTTWFGLYWATRSLLSWKKFILLFLVAFVIYFLFFTGPRNLAEYPSQKDAQYSLPWKAGVSRFISQGNRSYTTHRGFFEYSWDFWMSIGTEVLAARDGNVVEVAVDMDGIGFFHGNRIIIQHNDRTKAVYAHLKKDGALVKLGDMVKRGQPIGYSGMVGATINPHLHFHVISQDGLKTIPISFKEVEGGIPFAGHFYTSENQPSEP